MIVKGGVIDKVDKIAGNILRTGTRFIPELAANTDRI